MGNISSSLRPDTCEIIYYENMSNECIYKYVNLLYYKQSNTKIHIHVYALVGRISHNGSLMHGHESFKIVKLFIKASPT
jgi:hypothetical protein